MSLKATLQYNNQTTTLNDIPLKEGYEYLIDALKSAQSSCDSNMTKLLTDELNGEPTKKIKPNPEGEEENDDDFELEMDNGEIIDEAKEKQDNSDNEN